MNLVVWEDDNVIFALSMLFRPLVSPRVTKVRAPTLTEEWSKDRSEPLTDTYGDAADVIARSAREDPVAIEPILEWLPSVLLRGQFYDE